jgi:hypothetical protein
VSEIQNLADKRSLRWPFRYTNASRAPVCAAVWESANRDKLGEGAAGGKLRRFCVFDNRLGSKHQAFREVRMWIEERGIRTRQDFDELVRTDYHWQRRNIPVDGPFEWVHQPVTYEELVALEEGTLPLDYLINIKDRMRLC